MLIIFSVLYILIATAMIVLILMQRGEGANAGASFGGGSSGTVFGARGSANFMSRATGVLAGLFFLLSLGMGIYVTNKGVPNQGPDLGVMEGVATSSSSAQSVAVPAKPTSTTSATAVPKAAQPAAAASQSDGKAETTQGSAIPAATVSTGKADKADTGTTSAGDKPDSSGSSKN
ncbi:MAG TPA: preprotein translocase subunit SecG [Oleiagrimonas sp.]|nr:preprotein translocase subunit SecG [Oleiagrimonas sp.]